MPAYTGIFKARRFGMGIFGGFDFAPIRSSASLEIRTNVENVENGLKCWYENSSV